MTRRGAALLTALWFLVVAAGLALTAVGEARLGLLTSGNRVTLRRGLWAAEGCLALLRANFAATHRLDPVESVDLGDGVRCGARPEDPGARLNVNTASLVDLGALFGDDTVAAAIVDWIDADDRPIWLGAEREWYRERGRPGPRNGPLTDLDELLAVRGVDSADLLKARPYLTTRGTGRINVNAAPIEVLVLLPGMSWSYAVDIVAKRERGDRLSGVDELVARAPPEVRVALLDAYADLVRGTVFSAELLVVHLEGRDGDGPVARETVTIVATAGRLAVVRKEVW
jgi:type II secretory pathway component PulK